MKERKTEFIIVRFTLAEKESIVKLALEAKKRLSTFVRLMLGFK